MNNEVTLPPYVINEVNPVLPMSQSLDWGMTQMYIPDIHALGITGKGITIAVIDTAIDVTHPDLQGVISGTFNFAEDAYVPKAHHGTGVAGVIAAQNNEKGVLGVAPDAKIVGIKVLNEDGSGSITNVVQGILKAIELKVDIINMSLGANTGTGALKAAVEKARDAGIHIICAAGNSGADNDVCFPARYDQTVGVAATNQQQKVSVFSSRGWEVDIAAPGERILTTWTNHDYAKVSGTSFATPYVAGLYALFLQAGVQINHELLKKTAIDIEEPGNDTKSGYGLINPKKIVSSRSEPVEPQVNKNEKVEKAYALLGDFLGKK